MLSFKNDAALHKIDSLLKNQENQSFIQQLKTLKVETLVQAELYEEALTLSEEVLKEPNLKVQNKICVLLERALLYEILEDYKKAENELNKVSKIYLQNEIPKERKYGKFLYRKSSLYRVQDKDSLGKTYALLAKNFGDSLDYKYVSAISNMLLGFLTDSTNITQRIFYLKSSLQTWQSVGDWHGMGGMYYSIGNTYKKANQTNIAKKYIDSAIWIAKPHKDIATLASAFKLKSQLFEAMGNHDSALVYFKRHQEMSDEYNLYKKNIKISQLDFKFQIEKENLQKNLLLKDLKQVKTYNTRLIVLICVLFLTLLLVGFLIQKLFKRNKSINSQKEQIKIANTELETSLTEKNILLKELHHRVRNNLSLILSLISFQNQGADEKLKVHLTTMENRIKAIAAAHEQFIYDINSTNENEFDLKTFLLTIVNSLLNLHSEKIVLNVAIDVITVTIDTALPVGIMVNELVSNTLKHVDVKEKPITIDIKVKADSQFLFLDYADNGTSFVVDNSKETLGLFIIESMVSQLNGTFSRKGSSYFIKLEKK